MERAADDELHGMRAHRADPARSKRKLHRRVVRVVCGAGRRAVLRGLVRAADQGSPGAPGATAAGTLDAPVAGRDPHRGCDDPRAGASPHQLRVPRQPAPSHSLAHRSALRERPRPAIPDLAPPTGAAEGERVPDATRGADREAAGGTVEGDVHARVGNPWYSRGGRASSRITGFQPVRTASPLIAHAHHADKMKTSPAQESLMRIGPIISFLLATP